MLEVSDRIVVGGWTARPDLNTFTRDAHVVRVEPKVMELFVRLAQSPGAVVSKAALLDSVWPGVAVGEDSLTRAMSELRRALDDDARNPRIIETIPKRGYRLIPPVAQPEGPAAPSGERTPPAEEHTAPTKDRLGPPVVTPASAGREGGRSPLGVAFFAGVVVVVSALALWARPWVPSASASSLRPTLILVGPFVDATGEPGPREAVAALVEQEISRHERLNIVPESRLTAVLSRMRRPAGQVPDVATALEVMARDGGIAALITGRVTRVGGDLAVVIEVSDAAGEPIKSFSAQEASERQLGAALASAARFQALADVRPATAAILPPVTTSSLEALRLFDQAVEVADANWASIDGPWEPVIEKLREALRLDPEFAMAKIWLAMLIRTADNNRLSYVGGEPLPASAYQDPARESLNALDGLSRPEQLFVRGGALLLLARRDEALAALEDLRASRPDFFELKTRILLADLYHSNGRWQREADQMVAIAKLRPNDFDAVAAAGLGLAALRDGLEQARPYAARARELLTPQDGQRENSTWRAAWVLHFEAFDHWVAGDYAATIDSLREIEATLTGQWEFMRDSLATFNGHFWLTLGRVGEARRVFELGGHTGQRETNLYHIASLFDDREATIRHLHAVGWTYRAVPFARVGLFDRAHEIIAEGFAGPRAERHVQALEAAAAGRFEEAIPVMQQIIDLSRTRPAGDFYTTSMTLAELWEAAGNLAQATRVLEEAVPLRPVYVDPGPAGGYWIKAQVKLVGAYRSAGRFEQAAALEAQVRRLMSAADPDHPFLRQLDEPTPGGS